MIDVGVGQKDHVKRSVPERQVRFQRSDRLFGVPTSVDQRPVAARGLYEGHVAAVGLEERHPQEVRRRRRESQRETSCGEGCRGNGEP